MLCQLKLGGKPIPQIHFSLRFTCKTTALHHNWPPNPPSTISTVPSVQWKHYKPRVGALPACLVTLTHSYKKGQDGKPILMCGQRLPNMPANNITLNSHGR